METNVGDRLTRHGAVRSRQAAGVAALIMVVYVLLAYGAYSTFTSRIPSGNDFFPRWYGTRALILEGRDPYSYQVTSEIQRAMYGRLARQDEDQVAFAYPLYVSFFVLPFALLPYPVAQACWLSALILVALAALMLMLRTLDWHPSAAGLLGLGLWVVLFYPTARSLVLGQLSIVVLALVALVLWAMHRGNPYVAGCSLALSTVKPQMIFLIVPFLLLWAWAEGRRRTVFSFLLTMAVLLMVTSVILPTWIPSFLSGLASYESYTSIYREGLSPLGVLISYLLPASITATITALVSAGLVAYILYAWVNSLRRARIRCRVLLLTLIVTLLLPAQTGTTNQVLLLAPILYWLARPGIAGAAKGAVGTLLVVGPWLLFLLTFALRDGENAIMSIPLPLAAIGLLWWTGSSSERGQKRSLEEPPALVGEDQGCRAYHGSDPQEKPCP